MVILHVKAAMPTVIVSQLSEVRTRQQRKLLRLPAALAAAASGRTVSHDAMRLGAQARSAARSFSTVTGLRTQDVCLAATSSEAAVANLDRPVVGTRRDRKRDRQRAMMPGMSGMELHARLLELDADQAARMLFLTGGASTEAAQRFLDGFTDDRKLDKPVDMVRLRRAVQRLLLEGP